MFQSKSACASDAFDPEHKRHVGVADRDALEVLVVSAHEIKEVLAAGSVENRLAIAGSLDCDGLVRRAALGKVIGAIENIAHREISRPRRAIHVVKSVADVQPGMDKNR